MALTQPELWVESGASPTFPAGIASTFFGQFRINTLLSGARVWLSRNWSSANEGDVAYENDSTGSAASVWFTGGGSTFDITQLASRPSAGQTFKLVLGIRTTGHVRVSYALLSSPTTWVSGETATGNTSVGSPAAMNVTSNANGALVDIELYCAFDGYKPETDFNGENYDQLVGNTSNRLTYCLLQNGDVTSPWTNLAATGSPNDLTQQGGTAPTNVSNWLAAAPAANLPRYNPPPRVAMQRAAFR
jgi:hypothetical protein